jgi:hypothetical protein
MSSIEQHYDRGIKTFIAAAVGGPWHGKLIRSPAGMSRNARIAADLTNNDSLSYRLHVQPDGVRIWLHSDSEVGT